MTKTRAQDRPGGDDTDASPPCVVDRREFLCSAAAAAAAGLVLPLASACGDSTGSTSDSGQPDAARQADANASDGEPASRSTVAVVRRDDIAAATRDAIELAGGLGNIVGGDTVVIKPNLVATEGYGGVRITTHTAVMRAVIEAVAARTDVGNITVAESSALGLDTETIATATGYIALCEHMGVSFVAWDKQEYTTFQDPRWTALAGERRVPATLHPMSFEHFINVPILKNHEMVAGTNVEYTCCLKNFVGVIPYDGEGSRQDIHEANLGDQVAELGTIVPEITMNVVDAITAILTNGPSGYTDGFNPAPMDLAEANLIVASPDRVACDSVAMAVLKYHAELQDIDRPYVHKPVWDQAQIRRAAELGLGLADPARIDILASDVEEIEQIRAQWA